MQRRRFLSIWEDLTKWPVGNEHRRRFPLVKEADTNVSITPSVVSSCVCLYVFVVYTISPADNFSCLTHSQPTMCNNSSESSIQLNLTLTLQVCLRDESVVVSVKDMEHVQQMLFVVVTRSLVIFFVLGAMIVVQQEKLFETYASVVVDVHT